MAASLADVPPELLPGLLRERLSDAERALFERAARPDAAMASPEDCVSALKRLRSAGDRDAQRASVCARRTPRRDVAAG
jgi:hypothetical protein